MYAHKAMVTFLTQESGAGSGQASVSHQETDQGPKPLALVKATHCWWEEL